MDSYHRSVLADLLAQPQQLGEPVTGAVLDDALALLEDAAAAAVRDGGWTSDDPLRLSKWLLTWLLRCPRRAVSGPELDGAVADLGGLVIGLIIDAGAKLATLTSRTDPITVDDTLAFLDATGDTRASDHLADLDLSPPAATGATGAISATEPPGSTGSDLRAEAGARLARLTATWPVIDPGWWPRVEEPVRVRLADGAVTLGGRLDVLLGGPPTGRPGLVIEVKSGRWHDAVRADAQVYGLLVGLRDGVAPAAVVTVAAGDGATQREPIRPAVLQHTAERVAVALRTAGGLAAGEAPAARPGTYCGFCPLRDECPEGRAATKADAAA